MKSTIVIVGLILALLIVGTSASVVSVNVTEKTIVAGSGVFYGIVKTNTSAYYVVNNITRSSTPDVGGTLGVLNEIPLGIGTINASGAIALAK